MKGTNGASHRTRCGFRGYLETHTLFYHKKKPPFDTMAAIAHPKGEQTNLLFRRSSVRLTVSF
ncbi:MAG: hypothetical protein J5894_02970, partial [Clostridia bacterium]|nr:hypothetical protein [Clostridia bacterium]